jgi:hypothetical protein
MTTVAPIVDLNNNTCRFGDLEIELKPMETGLAFALRRRAPSVVTYDELLVAIWGANGDEPLWWKGSLQVIAKRLRAKLEHAGITIAMAAGRGLAMVWNGQLPNLDGWRWTDAEHEALAAGYAQNLPLEMICAAIPGRTPDAITQMAVRRRLRRRRTNILSDQQKALINRLILENRMSFREVASLLSIEVSNLYRTINDMQKQDHRDACA